MASNTTRRIFTATLAFGALLGSALIGADANAGGEFSVSVSNGKAKVGEAGTIVVTVTAADGYKANKEYPHKIKNIKAEGATVAKTVRGSASGKSISYSVSATPNSKGSHAVTGQIKFSVCNDETCLMKKAPLNATITGM